MKKVLNSIKAILIILITSYLSFGISQAKADEIKNEIPFIYYNTSLKEGNIKEMIVYENNIYLANDKKIFKYDLENSQWVEIHIEVPIEGSMENLKVIRYNALRNQIIIKNNNKIMMDRYNDGKEIYELNIKYENGKEKYYWEKFIVDGRIVKRLEEKIDEYKVVSIEEDVGRKRIRIENEEYYFQGNNLYVKYDDKIKLIKEYDEERSSLLKIKRIKDDIFLYGDKFGIELIEKIKINDEFIYKTKSIGKIIDEEQEISVAKLVYLDNSNTLFVLGDNNKVYKVLIGDTWVQVNAPLQIEEEIRCSKEEKKVKEFIVNGTIYKIVNDSDSNKSYITINDRILESTIKGLYRYPDNIFKFKGCEEYIYFSGSECNTIRLNIKNNNVEFMGDNDIFKSFANERFMINIDNDIFIEKSDGKIYKYISKEKFYDAKAPSTITAIEVLNDECYAISREGLYKFNSNGKWQIIVENNLIMAYPEQLISLDNKLFAISEGVLYKLNSDNMWSVVEGKINSGLTNIYYNDIKNKKIYFIANENGINKYVNIYDYGKKQWSRTKELSAVNGINSIVVDDGDIYISTNYFSDGGVYFYKNFAWNSLKEQFFSETDAIRIYPIIYINNKIYIQIESISDKKLSIFEIKSGKIKKVDLDIDQQNEISAISNQERVYSTSSSIEFQLKNGMVLRKVK